MTAGRSRLRSGIVMPVLFALTAVAIFLALGTWQLERKAWKENLIKTMNERISAAPIELPARATWPQLDATQDEFRHVRFSATFVPVTGALVYAGAPASNSGTPGPGYWAFALARVGSGDKIVINRGFVPDARTDVVKGAAPPGKGRITYTKDVAAFARLAAQGRCRSSVGVKIYCSVASPSLRRPWSRSRRRTGSPSRNRARRAFAGRQQ